MSALLLISRSPKTAGLMKRAWDGEVHSLAPATFPANTTELFAQLKGMPQPSVVVLDPGAECEAALSLAEQLDREFRIGTVLVTDQCNELSLPAMRAGVRDIVPAGVNLDELRGSLQRASAYSAQQPQRADGPIGQRGKVVAVASPKGGVGKTTVATNLAIGLAQRYPQATALVDVDIHFGDVASALNVNAEFSLPDLAHAANGDALALKTHLHLHPGGLYVVPGSNSPAAADAVTSKEVADLLDVLAGQFQYVVADTAPGLSEHTLAVLDQTDILVLVTSLDVPGVLGLRKELATIREIGLMLDPRAVVVNFMHPSRGITVADVEASIGRKVDIQLPQSNAVPMSVNQGIPLLQAGNRDAVARQLRSLVDLVDAGHTVRGGLRLLSHHREREAG